MDLIDYFYLIIWLKEIKIVYIDQFFLKKNMNYNDQNEKNVFQKKKNYKVQFLYNPTLNDKIKKKKIQLELTWVGMLNMQSKS